MASTYSPNLKLELIGTGDQSGVWGTTTNNNLGTLLEQAITGIQTITMVNANYTLTSFNGISDEARSAILLAQGTNSAIRDIITPPVSKVYIVRNNTNGGFAINIRTATGSPVTIASGASELVYCDGTDFYFGVVVDKVSLGIITSATGSEILPVGTTAQRDAQPEVGYLRYNSTLDQYESVYSDPGISISTITKAGTTAVLTTNSAHGLTTGNHVIVSGAIDVLYNGNFQITVTGSNSFTYTMTAEPAANAVTVGSYVHVYWQAGVNRTSATGSLILPSGTTAERDATPEAGFVRFNDTLAQFEVYNGTGWETFGTITSETGSQITPSGTTAQRDATPVPGYFRYNITTNGFEGVSAANGATINTITRVSTTATLTTATPHGLDTNDYVVITGAVEIAYNGTYQVTVTGADTFTYVMATTPSANATVVGSYKTVYWGSVGGGATGNNGNQIFYENEQIVTANYTITSGRSAMSTGPITVNTDVTVTVPSGSRWVIL